MSSTKLYWSFALALAVAILLSACSAPTAAPTTAPQPTEATSSRPDADAKLRYTFFNIDSIFDFLLSIGMKPFIELGSPEYPNRAQLDEIEKASQPVTQPVIPDSTAEGCVIRFTLPPHGVAANKATSLLV